MIKKLKNNYDLLLIFNILKNKLLYVKIFERSDIMKFDRMSLRIINKLLIDGRKTHQSLANELSYSRPAIHQRINKLEKNGIINGYTADIDYSKLGFGIEAFVLVNIHTLDYNSCIQSILDLSREGIYVKKAYRITGQKCIIVKLFVSSTENLRIFHDEILKLDGLIETDTMVVMQEEDNELKEEYIFEKMED